jgi:hypothetical protein
LAVAAIRRRYQAGLKASLHGGDGGFEPCYFRVTVGVLLSCLAQLLLQANQLIHQFVHAAGSAGLLGKHANLAAQAMMSGCSAE